MPIRGVEANAVNAFLASLPAEERSRISELAEQVTDFALAWSAPYGIFETVRFPAIALSMAAAGPWLSATDLGEMALIPVWIYAIDDAFDRRVFASGDRWLRVRRYTAVAAGRRDPWAGDPYAASLAEITARLRGRRYWSTLGAEWADACRQMLAGMAFECDAADTLRAGGRLPTLRTYMEHALHSIGVPMYLAGAWLIAAGPEVLTHLTELRRLARCAGRAVRLANDLRTHGKEVGEGNFNALLLLTAGAGMAEAEAVQCLEMRVQAGMRRLRNWAGALSDFSAAALALRVTRFAIDLYEEYDYHEVSRALIHQM